MTVRRAVRDRRALASAVRERRALASAISLTAALLCPPSASAEPSIWDRARDPNVGKAAQLLAVAERSRVPAEDALDDAAGFLPSGTTEELNRQLNARAAALITIADGHTLGDSRVLYLLGDALIKADKSYLPEGRMRLRQALEADPTSPLAGDAWFSLAIAEGKLRQHAAEREAYTRALEHEWQPELQATIIANRAESTMSGGDLGLAIEDYRRAIALTRSATTRALALWGLAVATERSGDLPSALQLARQANAYHFGPPNHVVVALDLPSVYFTPEYEEHYYRALAAMADAAEERKPEQARLAWQTASLLWSLYLDNAQRDGERWLDNARRHREACRQKLARIDADKARRAAPASGTRSDEH